MISRNHPEAQGLSSNAILKFLEAAKAQNLEFHSLMLLRHGQVITEGWWHPYAPEIPHMLFSLSKSFTASAIGLLSDAGKLTLDDTVISFFPNDLPPTISPNLAAMNIRHLLMMASGHTDDPTNASVHGSGNWVKTILEHPVDFLPGTHFVYNSGATFLLSAIVQQITGKTLLEFLKPSLLEPLGILEATWGSNPQGINFGAWGLNLTTESIAKLGQLYLQKGVWNGSRILSEAWINDASSFQISNGDKPTSDWQQGYGFQFWRCQHGAYRADGAFGQYCVVMPEQDAVLVITSAVNDMQIVLNLVWEHILPHFGSHVLPENPSTLTKLQDTLSKLELEGVTGENTSVIASRVSNQKYKFDENHAQIEEMQFLFLEDQLEIQAKTNSGEHILKCGYNHWIANQTLFEPTQGFKNLELQKASLTGAWINENTFEFKMCFNESTFTITFILEFLEQELTINSSINVGFGETVFKPINSSA